MEDRNRGIYGKFIVRRTDKRDWPGTKHHRCDYFVLDLTHDPHALPALRAYMESCEEEFPRLARDLKKRIGLWEHAQQLARKAEEAIEGEQ